MATTNNPKAYAGEITQVTTKINGSEMVLEYGRFAEQATSAVFAAHGDTQVLSIITLGNDRPDAGYFPMSVEYQERLYAGGKIKGSRWIKREGRPSDDQILVARLIDRTARPLFPDGITKDLQIINLVLSVDGVHDPALLAANATFAALSISPIPWNGPVAISRIGLKDGQFISNPKNGEREESDLDLVVSSSEDKVVMIEAGANQIPEEKMLEAIKLAQQDAQSIIKAIQELTDKVGQPKFEVTKPEISSELQAESDKIVKKYLDDCKKESKTPTHTDIEPVVKENLAEGNEEKDIKTAFEKSWKKSIRQMITGGSRPDGRKIDELRQIGSDVGLLKRTHGSGVFRRGSTHVLSITALGAPSLHQIIESAADEEQKRFIHHYSMPPYTVGETGRLFAGRREIGHGALVEKALEPVIPSLEEFPYTIMVVSEVMSSNGSTSMGSTCGTTLSLMDAGVPLKAPVSGIAMGLVNDAPGGPMVLTDIAGIEDFNGDMDFKVAGTEAGITAIQLDMKVHGITLDVVKETIAKARTARMKIMETMIEAIPEPRKSVSQYAPKIEVVQIPTDKIGEVIGPGGKMIRRIIAETGSEVDVDDDGKVTISAVNQDNLNKAAQWVRDLTTDPEVGKIYDGKVMRIMDFGAFVEILPGKEGLVHVTRMSHGFVNHPSDVVTEGQAVQVKVYEIDDMGRVNLTMLLDNNGGPSEDRGPQRRHTPGSGRQFGNRPQRGGRNGGFNRSNDRRGGGGHAPRSHSTQNGGYSPRRDHSGGGYTTQNPNFNDRGGRR